jgi:uncharacterized linocin/CFP29 family protein
MIGTLDGCLAPFACGPVSEVGQSGLEFYRSIRESKGTAMNNSNGFDWADSMWQAINDGVLHEMGKVRVAQKIFPTTVFQGSPTQVANDVINLENFGIPEGNTKSFVEIYQEFPLTNTQVGREAELKTCKTLARMAAKAIALAEDEIIWGGLDGPLPPDVQADQRDSTEHGLLGEANPDDADDDNLKKVSRPIPVDKPIDPKPGVLYGENVFSAVAEGIAKLVAKAQAPMYALVVPTRVHADIHVPPGDASLVTTAERLIPMVQGGLYGTGTLPPDKGLLVALGGDPTSLYVGREATTEFVRKEGALYLFKVVERIQFVARDPRALVLLQFN